MLRIALYAVLLSLPCLTAMRAADTATNSSARSSATTPMSLTNAVTAQKDAEQALKDAEKKHTDVEASNGSGDSVTIDTDDDDDGSGTGRKHHKIIINGDGKTSSFDLEDVVIPIFGITASFGAPVLIVFFICYFRYRRRKEHLATVRDYLNKGVPVPPQLLEEYQTGGWSTALGGGITDYSSSRAVSDMRRGVRLAFIGLGITLAFFFFFGGRLWAWGLVPLVIGLGFIVSSYAERRTNPGLPPADRGFTTPPPVPAPQPPPPGTGPFV